MNHPHARQLLGFYRSCYLADSRDLDNLGKLPASRWAWLDGRKQLASGGIPLFAAVGRAGACVGRGAGAVSA